VSVSGVVTPGEPILETRLPPTFLPIAIVGAALCLGVGVYLNNYERTLPSQTLGNFAILGCGVVGTLACARAAVRDDRTRRGWALLTAATLLWTLGQAYYTALGWTRNHVYPFPSLADLGYLGVVPAMAGIFAFPRPAKWRESRLRAILDALVITLSVLFISWDTVLYEVVGLAQLDTVGGLVGLAYPIADIAMCSAVLALGMRQPRGERLVWVLLGSGLVILAVTDTTYVWWLYQGHTGLTGTPLVFGWMACYLLITLATLAPTGGNTYPPRDVTTLALELIPYIPVLGAILVIGFSPLQPGPFLTWTGIVLVLSVGARQVMIIYQNVALTHDLEGQVAARTSESKTLGSIVTSSADAIVGVSLEGVVTSWNPAAERLFGASAEDRMGLPPPFLNSSQPLKVHSLIEITRQGGAVDNLMIEWPQRGGGVAMVNLAFSPISDGGVVRGISIFGQDITERQQTLAALASVNEGVTRLADLGNVLQACVTSDEAYAALEQSLTGMFSSVLGRMYIFNPSRTLLERKVAWGGAPSDSHVLIRDNCWALRRGQPHHVLASQPHLSCAHVRNRSGDSICIPMSARGEIVGVLHLMGTASPVSTSSGRLAQTQTQLGTAVAEQAALALSNLSLHETLRAQALRDPLTGLFNRRFVDEWIIREVNRADRAGTTLGVIMADLDHFKQINDLRGHDAGDAVLVAVADLLRTGLRAGDVACRYGGEEFLILLTDVDTGTLAARAEQLRSTIAAAQIMHNGVALPAVTFSVGTATYPGDGQTPNAVITAADSRLFAAKRGGRNRVWVSESVRA